MQIEIKNYPQLSALCWNRAPGTVLDGAEAFALYERNWRFVDLATMSHEERRLLDALMAEYGDLLTSA